jgi:hypothetical protein
MTNENEKDFATFGSQGIKCDACPWRDDTVLQSDYENWLNRPCPDCGENLLTQESIDALVMLQNASDFINQLLEQMYPDWVESPDTQILEVDITPDGYIKFKKIEPIQ